MVSPTVFWPIPRVYSGLVRIDRHETSPWPTDDGFRDKVFELIDIGFAQRRKTSRNAFLEWAGSGNESAERLLAASIDPARRGETLAVADFVRLYQRSGDVGAVERVLRGHDEPGRGLLTRSADRVFEVAHHLRARLVAPIRVLGDRSGQNRVERS